MRNDVKRLLLESRDRLIQDGLALLRERQPRVPIHSADYRITVWHNLSEVQVRLTRLIRYLSVEEDREFDIIINLIEKTIFPFDRLFQTPFFVATADEQKILDMVKRVTGIGNGYYADADYSTTVTTDDKMIFVHISTDASFRNLFLDKVSGEPVLAPLEGSYAVPSPKPSDAILKKSEVNWIQHL